jgi:uncharacterized protein (DUF697 family)
MTEAQPAMSKQSRAEAIINRYLPWSMGAGLVPIPIADAAMVVGIQVKMLAEISQVYSVEFSENAGKAVIASLIGGVGSTTVAAGTFGSLIKGIPGFGAILGAATLPVIAGATTYAIGKVFTQHFESGGTFLTFDSVDAKKVFDDKLAEGKSRVSTLVHAVDAKVSEAINF